METKSHYFLVGVFTLSLSLGIVFFLSWLLSEGNASSNFKKLLIYFPNTVSGLSEGSQVTYRGVQVGTVTKISLDPTRPQFAFVMTHIKPDIPLRSDTTAVLGNTGITGLTYIELTTENDDSPQLQILPETDHYVLEGKPSRLELLLQQAPALIKKYTQVGDQLLALFSQKNIDTTSKTIANVEKFTHNLADQQANLNQILLNTRDTIADFKINSATSFNELNDFLRDSSDAATEVKDLAKTIQDNPSSLIYQPNYHGYYVDK